MFDALSALATRRWPIVLVATLVFAAIAVLVGTPVVGELVGGGFTDPTSSSAKADRQLERASGIASDQGVIALVRTPDGVTSPAGQAEVRRVADALHADPAIVSVVDAVTTPSPALVARDGRSTYVVGNVRALSAAEADQLVSRLESRFAGDPAVTLGGQTFIQTQTENQSREDLARAESIAIPILLVLLLLVFRGLVAALLPLVVGVLAILTTFLAMRAINSFTTLSVFALNVITALGLGLAIDYSLLFVSRYREEVAAGAPRPLALERTIGTTGRTILFSSLTVAGSGASLLIFRQQFLYSVGIGTALTALSAASVALLVLPAVLSALGPRLDALRLPLPGRGAPAAGYGATGAWYRLASFVVRHALPVAVLTTLFLLALASPFLRIRVTAADASVLPQSTSARQVSDALERDFPPNQQGRVTVVVSAGPDAAAQVSDFAATVGGLHGVASAGPAQQRSDDTWEIDLVPSAPALSDGTQQLVRHVRGLDAPFPVLVTGPTASFLDLRQGIIDRLPVAVAIVAAITIVVLFAMTGSVILPVKAVVMNILSLSAAFGVLVLVFQDGHLQQVFRFTSQGAIDVSQPVLIFALAFGLATDYGVFLLNRIKEFHDRGLPTQEAVARGLERTGRIVTAAAALFCVAVGALATSSLVMVKEVGVGTAVAVLIDSTIVRALLVPSLMGLLAEWNWWSPRWLAGLRGWLRLDRLEAAPEASSERLPAS